MMWLEPDAHQATVCYIKCQLIFTDFTDWHHIVTDDIQNIGKCQSVLEEKDVKGGCQS